MSFYPKTHSYQHFIPIFNRDEADQLEAPGECKMPPSSCSRIALLQDLERRPGPVQDSSAKVPTILKM
jgi:hypothetical protein